MLCSPLGGCFSCMTCSRSDLWLSYQSSLRSFLPADSVLGTSVLLGYPSSLPFFVLLNTKSLFPSQTCCGSSLMTPVFPNRIRLFFRDDSFLLSLEGELEVASSFSSGISKEETSHPGVVIPEDSTFLLTPLQFLTRFSSPPRPLLVQPIKLHS